MFDRFTSASGFIFDCDGTLLDSMGAWREVEFALIDMTGADWSQGMLEEMRAAPMREACRIFHERFGLMDSTDDVVEYMESRMTEYYTTRAEYREGAEAFLWRLRENDVPCSIVSSTPARWLHPALELVGATEALVCVISTEESGMTKQDPAIYELALDKMGAAVETSWGVEDSLYAIRVMAAMGMNTIGAYDADDSGSFEDLTKQATLAIKSFTELL
jgi:HAD superfamily hydrolase (TIGR01509 family)